MTLAQASLWLMHCQRAGRADTMLEPVSRRLQAMAASRFDPKIGTADVVQAAARLGSKRIILADKPVQRLCMRVRPHTRSLQAVPSMAACYSSWCMSACTSHVQCRWHSTWQQMM